MLNQMKAVGFKIFNKYTGPFQIGKDFFYQIKMDQGFTSADVQRDASEGVIDLVDNRQDR